MQPLEIAANKLRISIKIIRIMALSALNIYQRSILLVRPDQHIAWRGNEVPEDVGVILKVTIGK